MNGRLTEAILLLLLIPCPLWSQDPVEIRNRSIDLLQEGKNIEQVEAFCEEYASFMEHPLYLNTASESELEASGLLSSYQLNRFILYRKRYGSLLSIYELEAVDGFSARKIQELLPYVRVTADNEESGFPRKSSKNLRGDLLVNGTRTWPGTDLTQTSALNSALKLNCSVGKGFSGGIAYQKDPGEKALCTYGPEHLSGYVSINTKGTLDALVLGNYRLHNGLGLLIGTASFGGISGKLVSSSFPRGIRPYAGNCEWGIHQGIALSLRHLNMRLRIWSSWQRADLSLFNCPSPHEVNDWRPFLRESGFHRSESEIAGRNLVSLAHSGISIQNIHPRFSLGMQYLLEYHGLTQEGRDSLGLPARTMHFHRSSFYGRWNYENLFLFCEVSPEKKEKAAALAGLVWIHNDYLEARIQAYYYGREFQDIFSGSYARGATLQDEQGLLIQIKTEVLSWLSAKLILELSNKPTVHLEKLPQRRLRESLILENSVSSTLHWRIRMQREANPDNSEPELCRLEARYRYSCTTFRWQGAIALNAKKNTEGETGQALLQEITLRPGKQLGFTTQIILFQVPNWEQRIYFYRPGLYRQFSFPAYSGSGNSLSLYATLKARKRFTLEASMSRLKYYNIVKKESEKFSLSIQLRMKL